MPYCISFYIFIHERRRRKNKPNKTIETKITLANIHLIEPSMTAILSNDSLRSHVQNTSTLRYIVSPISYKLLQYCTILTGFHLLTALPITSQILVKYGRLDLVGDLDCQSIGQVCLQKVYSRTCSIIGDVAPSSIRRLPP